MVKDEKLEHEKHDLLMELLKNRMRIQIMHLKLTGEFYLDIFKIIDYNNDSYESIRIKLHERSTILKRLREIVTNHGKYQKILRDYCLLIA
jgi:hypothetical protein